MFSHIKHNKALKIIARRFDIKHASPSMSVDRIIVCEVWASVATLNIEPRKVGTQTHQHRKFENTNIVEVALPCRKLTNNLNDCFECRGFHFGNNDKSPKTISQ